MVLEKTLESPLDCKEIQLVNPKGNQSWIFIGRTDAETEAPIFWPLDVKNWLIGKDRDAVNDGRQEEKGTTEDEMVGWHHQLSGHEFEQAPGVGDGHERLACCSPWGHKESDTTEQLNWFIKYLIVFNRMFFTTQLPPVRDSVWVHDSRQRSFITHPFFSSISTLPIKSRSIVFYVT